MSTAPIMKVHDPEPPAGWRSWRTKVASVIRFARRLPIPLSIALGLAATLGWVVFLCWAAFSLVVLLIG
jgi:hypothetical protein